MKTGDLIPDCRLFTFTESGIEPRSSHKIFEGRRIILLGVPAAFSPTCTKIHVEGFVRHADDFRALAIDEIMVVAVNDCYVLQAWAEFLKANHKLSFFSDGNGEFTKAIGMTIDMSERGMGIRSQRYSLFADKGMVKIFHHEPVAKQCTLSSAGDMLKSLSNEA